MTFYHEKYMKACKLDIQVELSRQAEAGVELGLSWLKKFKPAKSWLEPGLNSFCAP